MEQTKEALFDLDNQDSANRRKKPGEIEVLRNLVNKASKITCMDTQAEKMFEDLALRLWELEFQRFEMCDEVTVEQLQDLSQRALMLKNNKPVSVQNFQEILQEVEEGLKYFESLLEQDISHVIIGEIKELQKNINFYKERLDKHGIIMPEKYNKLLTWDK